MDLTVLANFWSNLSKQNQLGGIDDFDQFQSNLSKGNQLSRIDDLGEYQSNSSKGNQLGGFDDFVKFSPFLLLHAFLDTSLGKEVMHACCFAVFDL